MTMIEAVRTYIQSFPALSKNQINVDFLPEKVKTYSVDVIPCKEFVRWYADGSSIRQFLFVFATRAFYGAEIRQQLDNLGLFEDFANWIESNQRKRIFPKLPDGKEPQKIEVSTSGYAFLPGGNTARYQIQCRLEYFQPAGKEV